ncbi:unnamed protein product [Prorocentrum cordatum]|uniref:Uncharacterized protein n=1 Tax=Prorocentrum cordatum TaxID=2364126 RepID=A0ABN9U230_9DINO|nr:unnamed protein product [Polarella glacialis]
MGLAVSLDMSVAAEFPGCVSEPPSGALSSQVASGGPSARDPSPAAPPAAFPGGSPRCRPGPDAVPLKVTLPLGACGGHLDLDEDPSLLLRPAAAPGHRPGGRRPAPDRAAPRRRRRADASRGAPSRSGAEDGHETLTRRRRRRRRRTWAAGRARAAAGLPSGARRGPGARGL